MIRQTMSRSSKRPSSARRNIKLETFSSFASCSRLRNVQSILRKNKSADLESPDAILCVAGIDSRYHEGTSELINYLLFGFFEVRKAELEKSGFEEEVIDANEVHVYCNPINYHYLLPYVSHWRNVRFHCMTETEYEDEEAAEEFKIHSFINMVKGCDIIGIPYSIVGHLQTFDKHQVEKWPIVQAYALDDYGGGGFFTLKHEVVDASKKLHYLYSLMDPVAMEMMITDQLASFERQWNTMLTTMDPLKSYFIHGRVGVVNSDTRCRLPYVLFGSNSRKSMMENIESGGKTQKNGIYDTGVSPKGPVSCSRTYFLSEFTNPIKGSNLNINEINVEDEDTRVLTQVYASMVECVLEAINIYSTTLSVHKARATAIERLCDDCNKLNSPTLTKYLQKRSNIVFTLESYDNNGHLHETKEGTKCLMVKLASITLTDVPSNGTLVLDNQTMCLTGHIPRYRAWSVSETGQFSNLQDNLKRDLSNKYGKTLMPGENITYGTSRLMSFPQSEGQLYDSIGAVRVLCVEVKVTMRHTIPAYLLSKENIIYITFLPKTKAYKMLYMEVLPVWKEDTQLPKVEHSNDLHKSFIELHSHIQTKFRLKEKESVNSSSFKKTSASLPNLDRFLSHLLASSCINVPVKQSVLNAIINKQVTPEENDEQTVEDLDQNVTRQKIRWTVLTQPIDCVKSFVPEGLQKSLTSVLQTEKKQKYYSEDTEQKPRVMILTPGFIDIVEVVQAILCHPDLNVRKHFKIGAVTLCIDPQVSFVEHRLTFPFLLNYCAQGWVNNIVATSSTSLKNSMLAEIQDLIRSVNSDVSFFLAERGLMTRSTGLYRPTVPSDAFQSHLVKFSQPLERSLLINKLKGLKNSLSDLKLSGNIYFVQGIVRFTGTETAMEVHCTVTTQNVTIRPADNSYNQAQMLPNGDGCHGYSQNNFIMDLSKNAITILRKGGFDRLSMLKKLLEEFTNYQEIFILYKALLDSQTAMEVHCTVTTQYVTIRPADNSYNQAQMLPNGDGCHGYSQNNFIMFIGCQLEEKKLKDWLRTCAKQKPEKKKLLTRQDLNKKDIQMIHNLAYLFINHHNLYLIMKEAQHHLEPLPAGWFYNGTQFVSFDGEKQDLHPCLEDFIVNHIKEKNKEIEKYNADIEKSSFKDLFSN
ncbi:hypothetical protein KUTeg_005516 [Tegillarca granosa]|uniref:Uncharacterized protein n=1 Tax=Tegillarca granosa TaxID=220873 RepID=A0ABQ9FLU5_TEGGR|nr:hypothetical protein KUTeg_005516 [Tegillarca granosa]